jgi:nitric oxide reductase subunit B
LPAKRSRLSPAIETVPKHYESLFRNAPDTAGLCEAYAMKNDTVPDQKNRRVPTAFFWWTGQARRKSGR